MFFLRILFGVNLVVFVVGQGNQGDPNANNLIPRRSNEEAMGKGADQVHGNAQGGKLVALNQGALQQGVGQLPNNQVPYKAPVKLPEFKPSIKVPQAEIATSKECKLDVARICGDRSLLTNLEILSCMTERVEKEEDLTDECHEYLWDYKVNVTKDPKFAHVAAEVCRPAYSMHTDWGCDGDNKNDGKLIPCLLDHKNEITHRPCYHFLVKMGTIIFSDYRLVCDFVEDCRNDIKKYQCAKFPAHDLSAKDATDKSHSQGAVIKCLEEVIADNELLDDKCAKQIIRLSELSSDDYHLDRNLYFACKGDRDQLCEEVAAGEGRIYRCLFQHKFDDEMTQECREALTTRQRLVAQDFKASFVLQQSCKADIKKLNCMSRPEYKSLGGNDHSDVLGLSGMLLCMENAKLSDNPVQISSDCDSALVEFRRMLSEDYKMSPEIVHSCKFEIAQHCNQNGIVKNGGTIQCLMSVAQQEAKNPNLENAQLGPTCLKAMIHLLREDHVVADYKMDRALATACGPVASTVCKHHEKGDPLILSCLVENINTPGMTDLCRQRLLEIQYFLARDFSLDIVFYKKCHKDSEKFCDHKLSQSDSEVTMPFSMVMSCLYRHIANVPKAKKGFITAECADEVHRVMKSRALNFELNPDLEKACVHFLGKYCSEAQIDKGYELVCLQDHFENISRDAETNVPGAEQCVTTLEDLTELEEAEADDLDNILLRACTPDIDSFCAAERDSDEDGELMKCLVENKPRLNSADCRLGVEHMQIIELQDFKFSYNFMKACDDDIKTNCRDLMDESQRSNLPVKKNEVIECLSEKHLKSVLSKQASPLSDDCSAQLTVENFQRHDDNMKLNPEIRKACQSDYKKYCKSSKVKGMECLRLHHDKISSKCRKRLFKLEQEEAVNPNLDVVLMRTCKGSIIQLCDASADPQSILECLILNKDKLGQKCRKVIKEREREEFSDIDLNPQLLMECQDDLIKHCKVILDSIRDAENKDFTEEEIHGQAINCLKDVESNLKEKNPLSESCARHIRFVMKEEESDYQLDPMLTLKCVDSIQKHCPPNSVPDVVQCLKVMYFQGHINEQECMVQIARLLKEGRSDIMADPVLHNACQGDIQRDCYGIPEGRGRIMTCVLNLVDSGRASQPCAEAVSERKQMWKYAESKGVESFGHLAVAVYTSPHSGYLMTILSVILIGILIFGICCGRVTKRVSRQRKML